METSHFSRKTQLWLVLWYSIHVPSNRPLVYHYDNRSEMRVSTSIQISAGMSLQVKKANEYTLFLFYSN